MSYLKEDDANLLKSWQKYQRVKDSTKSLLSEKADALRGQLSLLDKSESKGADTSYLDKTIRSECASIVDFDESKKTLNNYAASILSNVKGKKVDSKEWKSGMTLDVLTKMPNVSKLQNEIRSTFVDDSNNGGKTLSETTGCFAKIPFDIPAVVEETVEKSSEEFSSPVTKKSLPVNSVVGRLNDDKTSALQNKTFYFEPKRKTNFDEKNEETKKPKRRETYLNNNNDISDIPEDGHFSTGNQELQRRVNQQVYKSAVQQPTCLSHLYGKSSRSLGGVRQNFKIPIPQQNGNASANGFSENCTQQQANNISAVVVSSNKTPFSSPVEATGKTLAPLNSDQKSLDPELVAIIESDILELKANVDWDAIAGLETEKASIKEMVVRPLLRPDLYRGLRAPPKGLLLYGPPGTGKTLIGRCIASQAKATFFNISASSLTSKWVGEGEKLVRTLFEVARQRLPSVIFIDEVDSLLSQRSENEHESSRRMKTEFFQQLDGAKTNAEDRLLLVGATNRPQELDAAARRRFTRRIYIPLPDKVARRQIVKRLLVDQKHTLTEENIENVAELTENYSCADVTNLCKEAALAPLRLLDNIEEITLEDVPPITHEHFENAIGVMGSSVSRNDMDIFKSFHESFGYNNKQQ